ncbi:MAG TPA: hypothetical protein VLD65_06210 [Anaerolineales bacterium]|nr:hypothetical protein [Anaerolineales bacterium]
MSQKFSIAGVNMRINRNMLLKLANDSVQKYVNNDRTVMAAYLQGSLLGESPLMGNTADIDLFFIHSDEVSIEREIVRVSDEVHLDISHHSHRIYRQPRELRLHPWLGPAVYGCKIMYDPQHFIDFVQASVRGQFTNPQNVIIRVRKQAEHARQIWEALNLLDKLPGSNDISLYLRALEHAAQAIAGLSGPNLTERRFLLELPDRAEAVHKPGLFLGFMGLLGATAVDAGVIRAWLPDWQEAYHAFPASAAPTRLHPHRFVYYASAIDDMLDGSSAQTAIWPLWHTWTLAICSLPDEAPQQIAWQKAGDQLGLSGKAFTNKVKGLDAYLDQIEELLDAWAKEFGG